jgi:non-ribosomal peptide synthetase component E (peptide arylation enzyme)
MPTLSSLEMNLLRRVTIGDIPKRTAAQCPDRTAIIFQGKRISYQELNENCCRFAHSFEALGAKKVIFVPSPTRPSGKVLKRLLKEQIMKQA